MQSLRDVGPALNASRMGSRSLRHSGHAHSASRTNSSSNHGIQVMQSVVHKHEHDQPQLAMLSAAHKETPRETRLHAHPAKNPPVPQLNFSAKICPTVWLDSTHLRISVKGRHWRDLRASCKIQKFGIRNKQLGIFGLWAQ